MLESAAGVAGDRSRIPEHLTRWAFEPSTLRVIQNEWQRKTPSQRLVGLQSKGMHDFILTEAEVGFRVAVDQDSEDCGWSALMDLSYEMYCREQDRSR